VSVPEQLLADDQPHHLDGALEYLVRAHVAQHALDRMIAQAAVTAMGRKQPFTASKPTSVANPFACAARRVAPAAQFVTALAA
jgi:hypothetical protein